MGREMAGPAMGCTGHCVSSLCVRSSERMGTTRGRRLYLMLIAHCSFLIALLSFLPFPMAILLILIKLPSVLLAASFYNGVVSVIADVINSSHCSRNKNTSHFFNFMLL
uniref:Uncharacterized protein n=1 Tax=Trypanosoma vivax (strain Y486) TaxID=1055687 RepID=G0U204_TRYVY|nr:hypothetical protein TVY486_0901290 [Trypanosoma vivax Y486]